MGIMDALRGRDVYLDTNVFIYALEGYPAYSPMLNELFDQIDSGQIRAFTSELTVAETLVKPLMDSNQELQEIYENVLQDSDSLHVVPITRGLLVKAARLRAANTALRLPDAIHIATAQDSGCETLITNDQRMRGLSDLHTVLLSEIRADEDLCESRENKPQADDPQG